MGLGGRLDATHAWDGGVAVVTNVSLDHTDRLGPTIEAIAREKAAIIMPGDRAVTGADGRRSRHRARAGAPGSRWPWRRRRRFSVGDRDGIEVELGRLGGSASGSAAAIRPRTWPSPTPRSTLSRRRGSPPSTGSGAAGYAAVRWPGRLELVEGLLGPASRGGPARRRPQPGRAAALAAALDDLGPFLPAAASGRPAACLGIMADKDVDGVIGSRWRPCGPWLAPGSCATAPAVARALPAAELAARWRAACPGRTRARRPTPDAGAGPRARGGAGGPVIVAGSLYLVGAARARLVDDPRCVTRTTPERGIDPAMSDRQLPDERGVVGASPDLGGDAATPSRSLPADASPACPARRARWRSAGGASPGAAARS